MRRFFLALLILLIPLKGLTQTNVVEGPLATHFESLDRSLKLSVLQPPSGFLERLHEFDRETGFIDTTNDWYAYDDADTWVYFLRDENDLFMVPQELQSFVTGEYDGAGLAYAQAFTVQHEGEIKPLAVTFFFVDKYEGKTSEDVGCLASLFLYENFVISSDDFDREREAADCGGF